MFNVLIGRLAARINMFLGHYGTSTSQIGYIVTGAKIVMLVDFDNRPDHKRVKLLREHLLQLHLNYLF